MGSDLLYLTPPEAAAELGVKADRIVGWINSGELRAANLATNPQGKRPRWKILRSDLQQFLLMRTTIATPKPERQRREKQQAGGKVFFE
jgi:excisionase family DNA binding protein